LHFRVDRSDSLFKLAILNDSTNDDVSTSSSDASSVLLCSPFAQLVLDVLLTQLLVLVELVQLLRLLQLVLRL
jgi:hypothetical protein